MSKRVLSTQSWLFLLFVSITTVPTLGQQKTDLKVEFPANDQCRVSVEVEHDGQVLLIQEDESAAEKSLPLKVVGKLKYFQRSTNPEQAIRYYESAGAEIKLEEGNAQPQLNEKNNLIIARKKAEDTGRAEMASLAHLLTQSELELIQTSADPLSLPRLLSREDVTVGQSWDADLTALAQFLNVEEIISSDVQLTLKRIDGNLARIFLSGTVVAAVYDVKTEISVSGIAMIDVKQNQVRNLKVGLDESRPAGQIEPGFDGRSRIDVGFDFEKSTDKLSNSALSQVVRSRKIQQRLMYQSDEGSFRITYDPRWKLIAGEQDTALLRFIDEGDLLTQCNVVLLPARPADKPLQLTKFKEEIAKAVESDPSAQLLQATESQTAAGLTALRVIVSGDEEGLPVNWFYYHISSSSGRQITFVFTLAESVSGRVQGVAEQLVNEFEFTQPAKSTKQVAHQLGDQPRR